MEPGNLIQLLIGIALVVCAVFFLVDLRRGRAKKIYTNATMQLVLVAVSVMAVGGILLIVKSLLIL
ncbi:MAG TPA: hypothetical protein PKX17_07270 [Candidatus Methanomethylicus sp.]|nr:hypothetical protein [Candidatus Methanomethylicus sp.]